MILLLPIFIVFQAVVKVAKLAKSLFIFLFEFLSGRRVYRRKYSYVYNYGSEQSRPSQRRATQTRLTEDKVPDETRAADDSKSGAK